MDIERKQAGHLIDEVAMPAVRVRNGTIGPDNLLERLEAILSAYNIPVPDQCHGEEVHTNSHIDHCSGCWHQQPTKVK